VAVDATKHDVLCFVHRFDLLMTLQTADAFGVSFALGLIDPITRR
jgi:hypothetical protein